jgi:hypothetical protein
MELTRRTGNAETGVRLPRHLPAGLLLAGIAWPLAWFGPDPWSSYTFFPLWLGYILTVDGVTALRTGTSLLTRSRQRFILLFGFSLPLWWLFEIANRALGNWRYQLPRDYDPLTYFLLASLAFSTVMPAIFVTAGLYRTLGPFAPARHWVRIAPSRGGLLAIALLGLAMFAASLVFPEVAFPLVWIGLFLAIDALNALTGSRSIAAQVATGRWDTVLVLFAAGLTCGVFWEMWNFWSMPKWVYDIPYAAWLPVFEMPLLGYGGYFPFALEVYAVYHLLHRLVYRLPDAHLRFDEPAEG